MAEGIEGRLTRRAFVAGSATAFACAPFAAHAEAGAAPVRIGSGWFTYELVPGWGNLPGTEEYGMGCGVVVDSKDRVYVHSRCKQAVAVWDRHGRLLNTFGAEFAATGHGLYWHREGADEYLYFSDHPRNLVVKTDLAGNVLLRIGEVSEESPTSIKFKFDQPTDVAIAPNGDIYVCEGYGGQHIHRFDARGRYLQTIGGPGNGPDTFNVCHGIWIDTRKADPEVYIADRVNNRVQVMTLDLKPRRSLYGDVRNPCCFYEQKSRMFIPDLDHRVTVLGEHDEVLAQLGDGRGHDSPDNPEYFRAPHALTLDSHGDLYVVEWLPHARLHKFRHTPNAA